MFGVVVLVSTVARFSTGFQLASSARRHPTRRQVLRHAAPGGADSLPLNFRSDNGTRDDEFSFLPRDDVNATGASVVRVQDNPYAKIVSSLSPGEMIGRFAETAPAQVQDAVRTTIVGLLGSSSTFAVETATVMTGERLANLMFQLQMTGYMFKNAEYRVSLAESLGEQGKQLPPSSLPSTPETDDLGKATKVSGKISVDYGGMKVSVDADAYMAELRAEVDELRSELAKVETEASNTAREDLLKYIGKLPEQQMTQLTSEVTEDVLEGMKMLVYSIMRSMGAASMQPQTLLQQSGSAMTQLLLWQLVIGYNLRELEVRDQLNQQLSGKEPSATAATPDAAPEADEAA